MHSPRIGRVSGVARRQGSDRDAQGSTSSRGRDRAHTEMCRVYGSEGEVSHGRAPVGGSLGVGELADPPKAAVVGIHADAAQIAGPAAAGKVLVVGLTGPRR